MTSAFVLLTIETKCFIIESKETKGGFLCLLLNYSF